MEIHYIFITRCAVDNWQWQKLSSNWHIPFIGISGVSVAISVSGQDRRSNGGFVHFIFYKLGGSSPYILLLSDRMAFRPLHFQFFLHTRQSRTKAAHLDGFSWERIRLRLTHPVLTLVLQKNGTSLFIAPVKSYSIYIMIMIHSTPSRTPLYTTNPVTMILISFVDSRHAKITSCVF